MYVCIRDTSSTCFARTRNGICVSCTMRPCARRLSWTSATTMRTVGMQSLPQVEFYIMLANSTTHTQQRLRISNSPEENTRGNNEQRRHALEQMISRLENMRENWMLEYFLNRFSSRSMLCNRDTLWISTLTKKFFQCYNINTFC